MSCYKEILVMPGSEDWLLWRRSHLCGTDSAKILGKNPWATPFDCYEEKIDGKTSFVTPAMQKGLDSEPIAREYLMVTYGVALSPKVFESTKFPFMGASLDAISSDNKTAYEIKCVGEKTMQSALDGKIEPMYVIQCQKQMLVTGLDYMFLFFYFNDFLTHSIKIHRDEFLIDQIIQAESEFWYTNILNRVPPEKYGSDYEKIADEQATSLACQWLNCNERERALKIEKEAIIKKLTKYTAERNCVFPEAKLKHQWIERKGLIDWNKVCLTWNITEEETERYRKESTNYSKFSEM